MFLSIMFDTYQMHLCIDILLLTLYPISNYEKPIKNINYDV